MKNSSTLKLKRPETVDDLLGDSATGAPAEDNLERTAALHEANQLFATGQITQTELQRRIRELSH